MTKFKTKWVGTGVSATKEEKLQIEFEPDPDQQLENIAKAAIAHGLPDYPLFWYRYSTTYNQFVYPAEAPAVTEWLQSPLGHEVEAWLAKLPKLTIESAWSELDKLNRVWNPDLKGRMDALPNKDLILPFLYRDDRWVHWKKIRKHFWDNTDAGILSMQGRQHRKYLKLRDSEAFRDAHRKTSRVAAAKKRASAKGEKEDRLKRAIELEELIERERDEDMLAIHQEELTQLRATLGRFAQRDIMAYRASLKVV